MGTDPRALTFPRPLAWAAAAYVAGVLLNADRVPLWSLLATLLLVSWRLIAAWLPTGFIRVPRITARTLIALILVAAVLARFRTLNGLSAGTALLMLMGASKLLEARRPRDEFIVIGAGVFLLLAACLDRQQLLRAPLYLLHVWLCCSAIAVVAYSQHGAAARSGSAAAGATVSSPGSVARPVSAAGKPPNGTGTADAFDAWHAVALAGRSLLLAVPLALVLFLFFPRLPGAFWALPRPDAASTGLSDTMSPGSITNLTTSYDIAFRARFEGQPPPPAERYWRGPVLHNFDGFTWRRVPGFYRPKPLEYLGTAYHYQITLEPSTQRWWFALDTPRATPDGNVYLSSDHELISAEPVRETTTYTAISYTNVRSSEPLSRGARRRDTTLPPDRNPRSRELALQLRSHSHSDSDFVRAVLGFLKNGGFEYSVTPPPLGRDSVDDFLFRTRQGFCGHFASAFVDLMREAGVPAHVVTGYLGGEWNPIGGYFTIRQSDAHAWAEVWIEERGWTRVDPTAVVEPGRLDRGILDLLPNAVSAPARMFRASSTLTALLQRWDALNAWWSGHVVEFDFRAQLSLLQHLGIDSPGARDLAWAFASGLIGWLLWIAWQLGRGMPGGRPDRLARAYARLCSKLGRTGVYRAAHQGPLAYSHALAARRPDLARSAGHLLEEYAQLRYGKAGKPPDPKRLSAFEKSVARLKVARGG